MHKLYITYLSLMHTNIYRNRGIYVRAFLGELWGELLANGSFNGMVGMMGREEGDMAVGNIYISSLLGRLNYLSYSASYTTDVSVFKIDGQRTRGRRRVEINLYLFTVHTCKMVCLN